MAKGRSHAFMPFSACISVKTLFICTVHEQIIIVCMLTFINNQET